MLAVVGAEYSRRVLFAMTSNKGTKFRLVEESSEAAIFVGDFNLDLACFRSLSGSEIKFSGRFLFIHNPVIDGKNNNKGQLV